MFTFWQVDAVVEVIVVTQVDIDNRAPDAVVVVEKRIVDDIPIHDLRDVVEAPPAAGVQESAQPLQQLVQVLLEASVVWAQAQDHQLSRRARRSRSSTREGARRNQGHLSLVERLLRRKCRSPQMKHSILASSCDVIIYYCSQMNSYCSEFINVTPPPLLSPEGWPYLYYIILYYIFYII